MVPRPIIEKNTKGALLLKFSNSITNFYIKSLIGSTITNKSFFTLVITSVNIAT